MRAKELLKKLEQVEGDSVITVLIGGIAYPVKEVVQYVSKSGMRILIVPNTKYNGSIPNLTNTH